MKQRKTIIECEIHSNWAVMFRIQERKAILLQNWPNSEKDTCGGPRRSGVAGTDAEFEASRVTIIECGIYSRLFRSAFQMTVTFGIHESISILLRNCPPRLIALLLFFSFLPSLSLARVCVFAFRALVAVIFCLCCRRVSFFGSVFQDAFCMCFRGAIWSLLRATMAS